MTDSLELKLETRQGGRDVTKLAAALASGRVLFAAGANAAGPALAPHVYGVKISGSRVAAFNATWLLGLKQRSFQLARNNAVVVSGTLKISGNRVTFHDISGPFACEGSEVNGAYTWKLRGKKLTFKRVRDACAGRGTILSVPYTKVR
jgi:hypothetical protein